MGTILSDATMYSDAIAATMRQSAVISLMDEYLGYQHMVGYPRYSTPGTFPLELGFNP
jgi:hypothetical protein